jgi:hypothetical protein
MQAAVQIRSCLLAGDSVLITPIEPAPWSMPPVDLFRWTIVLDTRPRFSESKETIAKPSVYPLNRDAVQVRPTDIPPGPGSPLVKLLTSCPISWASKPFEVIAPAHHPK